MNTLNSQSFYQEAIVCSGRTEEQLTLSLSKTASKCQEQNLDLHDFCRTYQSICHSQSGGNLETYSKVSRSCQIHSNGAAVPRWYACKGSNYGEFSDPFRVTNWFRQDCVLAVHCSAWCFRPCSQMLSRMVILIYLLNSLYSSKIDTFFIQER